MSYTGAYLQAKRLTKDPSFTLVALGVAEIVAGEFTGSVGLTADGTDSISDAVVSLLVWLGLKISRKAPDEPFHFGYYKVENMVAFVASIGLVATAGVIIYRSYWPFLTRSPLPYPSAKR